MMNHTEKRPAVQVSNKVVLLVTTMSSFINPFVGSAINIALPSIGSEFATDAVLLTWIATAYLLSSTVLLLPFGRIADIYGRKKIFLWGLLIYTVASLLAAISTSVLMLVSFRALQGIGGAMIMTTAMAILASAFPASERGKALGINVAAVYLGLSVGPFLGGILTQQYGWRSVFLANVLLGIIVIVVLVWKLKGEWAEAKGEKFDLSGSIIYALAFTAIMYGFSLLPSITGVATIIIGIFGILVFIWWETKGANPVLRIDLFRHNPVFVLSNLAALINYSATFAVTFLLSLYLQYAKGFSPQNAGLVLVSMPVVQFIFSPMAGRVSDKISPQILASIGMAMTTFGLVLLTSLDQNSAMGMILASLIVLGFGFALFSSPNTNAVMSSVEKGTYGVASAMLATMRQVGMMLSMGIAMLVFSIFIGRVEITPEYYTLFIKSVKIAFIFFASLCFAGIFASLAGWRAGENN